MQAPALPHVGGENPKEASPQRFPFDHACVDVFTAAAKGRGPLIDKAKHMEEQIRCMLQLPAKFTSRVRLTPNRELRISGLQSLH